MDNAKNDNYYLDRILADLSFIQKHTNNIESEELGLNEVLLDSMMLNIAGRRSRLPGGGGATCPDFWSRPACLLVILLFRDPIRRALS